MDGLKGLHSEVVDSMSLSERNLNQLNEHIELHNLKIVKKNVRELVKFLEENIPILVNPLFLGFRKKVNYAISKRS